MCVELKYCCDYWPKHQSALAETQHLALLAAMRGAGYVAHTVVLLLGVSGTLFTQTLDLLHAQFGGAKGACAGCVQAASFQFRSVAVVYLRL